MAVDEALMAGARHGRVTLRLYRWDPPCLSFGRNQRARDRYDLEAARDRGIEVVRRPTGGRAVFHHRELTYSVTAPAGLWGGLRASYLRINRALLRGLASLGAPVAEAERRPGRRSPAPTTRACFRDPLPGEITAAGRKLVGSAQWRDGGALLQHGSLLLHDDQATAEQLRLGIADHADAGEDGAVRAAALVDLLERTPEEEELAAALRAGFSEELGVEVVDAPPDLPDPGLVERLEARFRDPAWTWRR
jgi:lipoate-protein ligase A